MSTWHKLCDVLKRKSNKDWLDEAIKTVTDSNLIRSNQNCLLIRIKWSCRLYGTIETWLRKVILSKDAPKNPWSMSHHEKFISSKILWEKVRMFSLAWTHLTSLWPKFDHYSFTFHLWNKLMLNFHLNALFIIRFHIKYSSSVFQKWDLLILESLLVLLWHSGLISIQKILAVFIMLMIATVWMEIAAPIKRCVVSRNAFSALSTFYLWKTHFFLTKSIL